MGTLFQNEPERQHFAEYLTGLLVADRKNVSGINREFAVTTDQSCLNRWITTDGLWDAERLNEARLAWLQKDPATRYSAQGVIPLDNVLIDHDGKLIEDAGWFWDHAEQRNKIAHDYLIVNYVCTTGKHYPLEFRRFVKKDACAERKIDFRDHNVLLPGIDGLGDPTGYSRRLHLRQLVHPRRQPQSYPRLRTGLRGRPEIQPQDRLPGPGSQGRGTGRPDRPRRPQAGDDRRGPAVVFHQEHSKSRMWIIRSGSSSSGPESNDTEARKILVTNRTFWEVSRILRVYRRRWRGTECFHRDGKQHLGMGDCQLRDGLGQTRHMYLVFLAHSVLMRQLRQSRASEWARERLTTIGQACRTVLRETLSDTISWVVDRVHEDWNCERIKTQLALP